MTLATPTTLAKPGRLLGVISLLLVFAAQGVEVYWVAAGDGQWNDGANWSSGAPPVPGDDVVVAIAATPTVTFDGGNAVVNGLGVTGNLVIAGGSMKIQGNGLIDGDLRIEPGAVLIAEGPLASLSVSGSADIDGGSLWAVVGGRITLPTATRWRGPGTLRAQGAGSRLELVQLDNLGIGLPPATVEGLEDAVSREFSAFHHAVIPVSPLAAIDDAVSRTFSAYHHPPGEPPGVLLGITDAVSRSFSAYHQPLVPQPPLQVISDAVSRSFSAYHRRSVTQDPLRVMTDAVSREFGAEHLPEPGAGPTLSPAAAP